MDPDSSHDPARDPRILEALEACRPGHDDPFDGGMAELAGHLAASRELDALYERLQRTDKALAVAIRDVPVPPGLAGQVLAALAAAPAMKSVELPPPASTSAILPTVDAAVKADQPSLAVTVPGPGRKRLWALAAATAALAASLLVAVALRPQPDAVAPPNVCELAIDYFHRDRHEAGRLLADAPPPKDYPLSTALRPLAGTRWRWVENFLEREGFPGCEAVAYDLVGPSNVSATLYVAQGVPAPMANSFSSADVSVSVWQEGSLLYVLVVRGSESQRNSLFDDRGPVT